MNKRIAANLIFFGLITVLLVTWALNNVISLDAVKHPYKVTATFAQAPGLSKGTQVTYLGTSVGTVAAVKLINRAVAVTLKIDHGVKMPQAVSASVLRQSAVGEPYVELAPLPGTNFATDRRLTNGDHIAIQNTSTPLAYSDLFKAISDLVGSIPPQDLHTAMHELAVGLDGRGDSIRQMLVGADQLTSTFATHSAEIEATLNAMTQLTHTLAGQTGAIGSSIDNTAALAAQLHQSLQAMTSVLDNGPGFTTSVANIIAASKGSLGCTIEALGGLMHVLNDPQMAAGLGQSIAAGPTLEFIQNAVIDHQPDGPYIKGNDLFNIGQRAPETQYASPINPPPVPAIPGCAPVAAAPGAGPAASVSTAAAGQGAPANPGQNLGRPAHPAGGLAGPSTNQPGKKGGLSSILKKALLLLLLLLLLMGAIAAARRWLFPPKHGKGGSPEGESPAAIGPHQGGGDGA